MSADSLEGLHVSSVSVIKGGKVKRVSARHTSADTRCYARTQDAYHALLDALTRQAAQADIDDAPGRAAKYRAECEAVRQLFIRNF